MVCPVGHVALGFDKLDAGELAEPEGRGKFAHIVNAEIVAHGVEEVIARIADGGGDVFLRVGQMLVLVRVPDPALRGVAFGGVPGINALTLDLPLRIDDALGQTRDGGAGLEGGAGGVGAQQCPVEERGVLRDQQLLIVLDDAGDVVGRPARQSEGGAVLHVHHHGGGAGDVVLELHVVVAARGALGAFLGDVLFQNLHAVAEDTFGLLLQDAVDGEIDMVAGHRLLGIDRGEDGALGVARFLHLAVLAVEVVFKGVFDAVLAHHGVGGVVQQ